MTIDDAALRELRSVVEGQVLTPGGAGYDAARRIFNAMIDHRPAVIVRCAGRPTWWGAWASPGRAG
jgi:hypothetical protein